jgi:hypothetical protein
MGCRNFWARTSPTTLLWSITTIYLFACTQVRADNPESYCLIVSCKNDASVAEIYAPERICYGGYDKFFRGLQSDQRGFFALDLNQYGKGKPLEPIYIRAAKGNGGIIVDQFARRLPPTMVPRGGGTVSFDTRFAVDMLCSPLFDTGTMSR